MSDNKELDKKLRVLLALERKTEAVKLYKDVSGLSLKEAKEYVESLTPEMKVNQDINGIFDAISPEASDLARKKKLEALKQYLEEERKKLTENKYTTEELKSEQQEKIRFEGHQLMPSLKYLFQKGKNWKP